MSDLQEVVDAARGMYVRSQIDLASLADSDRCRLVTKV
jgi:hypothetical protein